MTQNRDEGWQSLAEITAKIVGTYLEKHAADVTIEALPKLVEGVRAALAAPPHPQLRPPQQEHRNPERHEDPNAWWPTAERLIVEEAERVAALRAEPVHTEDADWDNAVEPEIIPPTKTSQPPAVPIGTEITSEYIVCLEEGKRCRSMKGHLRAKHGLTPAQYRAKWGLPESYAMVPPNYSAVRRQISNQLWKNKKKDRT